MRDGQSHGFQNQNGLIWDALRVPPFKETYILYVYMCMYIYIHGKKVMVYSSWKKGLELIMGL